VGTITGDFDGETVVITGGSSGIGRAVALAFGDAGATVINADVRADPTDLDADQPSHEAIRERGGRGEYVETDVSAPDELESVIEAAREFGGVDVMVNNAGVHVSRRFREVTPADFEHVHGVNARGTFFGTQAAAEDMIARDEPGVILNTASTTADDPEWEHAHYAATKGAIRMITRSAALELAQCDVRVNSVAPGPIATEITDGWSERAEESVGSDDATPPMRAGQPADLAGAYLYLASEQAGYVTGEQVRVDGGAGIS
jgi:glucose 1-dehydrogenase